MGLSALEIDFFLTNGYFIINDFFSKADCEAMINRSQELIQHHREDIPIAFFSTQTNEYARTEYFLNSGDKIHFFFEPTAFDSHGKMQHPLEQSLNKIGHALHVLDPVFQHYTQDERLKIICHQLGMLAPSLVQSMYIFKQPHIGGEVNCHQDATYLHASHDDILGFWFALEDATIENGCLEVIPSPHNTPLKRVMIREENNIFFQELDPTPWREELAIPLEVKQGSLILLHGRVPHKSKANLSNKSRHAYTLHALDNTYPYPSTNWLKWPNGLPLLD